MAAETTLSQYEGALIRARTVGEIIRAAFGLQLAARTTGKMIQDFPYPSAAEMGEWGRRACRRSFVKKPKKPS